MAPTQSQDNPANLFMFMCFSFPWALSSHRPRHLSSESGEAKRAHWARCSQPCPSFPCFFRNARKSTKKYKDCLSLPNSPNPWKRRGKRPRKQGIPRRGKNKDFQKRQGKEGQGTVVTVQIPCWCSVESPSHPQQESSDPPDPKCPWECPTESQKSRRLRECPSGSLRVRSGSVRVRPHSVSKRCAGHSRDTLGTLLSGHFLDTSEPGPKGLRRHPLEHPDFRGPLPVTQR